MSDLHDPVNDPDDHYDLAVGFSTGLLEDALIVTDEAEGRRPARVSVRQLAVITRRPAPPVVRQRNIGRQLRFLRRSPKRSVTVITLGSLTGLAVLLERVPALLRSRVREVKVFAGDSAIGAEVEYNVKLDPVAFRRVLSSGLPIRWIPCFDGGPGSPGSSSFLLTSDAELTAGLRPRVLGWFERFIGDRLGQRGLWAVGNVLRAEPAGVRWQPARFSFGRDGILLGIRPGKSNVRRFVAFDRVLYEAWVFRMTRRALQAL